MYTRIIVPLDGSSLAEQVLPLVGVLADSLGARVELLQAGGSSVSADDVERIKETHFPESPPDHHVDGGEAAQVIVDRAGGDPGTLIAMATHGTSGMRRWLLGSVAAKVVQKAANPLLLVRPTGAAPARIKTVFVPLDGSVLAEKALPHAAALARATGAEMHLLRVYTLPPPAYVVTDAVLTTGPGDFREPLKQEAEAYLNGKVDKLQVQGRTRPLATAIEGDAAAEIIDIARKTTDSMVVMTTHGRSGVGRWLLGSIAEKVVQHSQDPVLIVRAA